MKEKKNTPTTARGYTDFDENYIEAQSGESRPLVSPKPSEMTRKNKLIIVIICFVLFCLAFIGTSVAIKISKLPPEMPRVIEEYEGTTAYIMQ
ncbi:MAG TPA: hypothetical protein GXZ23_04680 [Clostridiales bacterium]|nr:hypothetical protein [Clostridiales bacterium]